VQFARKGGERQFARRREEWQFARRGGASGEELGGGPEAKAPWTRPTPLAGLVDSPAKKTRSAHGRAQIAL
jgi:hypothetical protein